MADLSGVLGQVPFLAGWKGTDQLRQQEQAGQLAQAQNLMGILSAAQAQQQKAQAMREEQEIKGVLQASGGDMGRAIQALAGSGNPRYIEMAGKLKALSEKPQGQAIGSGGLRLPDGSIIPPAARPNDGMKAPPSRKIVQGEIEVHQELQPDGTWKETGRGPRFARQVAPIINVGGGRGEADKPLTDLAKLNADLKAGRITQEQFDASAGKKTGTGPKPLSVTEQKEIIQTDEELAGGNAAIQLLKTAKELNKKAWGFRGAGTVAAVGTLLPEGMRPKGVDATEEYDNVVTNSVLPQLKAIFGGMPTEGERKILIDVAGSSGKNPSVRDAILTRAINAANMRNEINKKKSQALRDRTYFQGTNTNNTTTSGWSIEPVE